MPPISGSIAGSSTRSAQPRSRARWHGTVPASLPSSTRQPPPGFVPRSGPGPGGGPRRAIAAPLEGAGVERDIAVVPDSALLLPRVLPAPLAGGASGCRPTASSRPTAPAGDRRPGQQHHGGAGSPAGGSARRDRSGLPHRDRRPQPLPRRSRLRHEAGRPRACRMWSVPEEAPLEAVAAAVAGADCFLGVSLHGAITAFAYGRPFASLDPFGQPKLARFRRADRLAPGTDARPRRGGAAAGRRAAGARHHLQRWPRCRPGSTRISTAWPSWQRRTALGPSRPLWEDTAVPLHLRLRRVPRPAVPAPSSPAPATPARCRGERRRAPGDLRARWRPGPLRGGAGRHQARPRAAGAGEPPPA